MLKMIFGIVLVAVGIIGAIVGVVLVIGRDWENWFYEWLVIGVIFFLVATCFVIAGLLFSAALRHRRADNN